MSIYSVTKEHTKIQKIDVKREYQLQFKREGKFILPKPFAYDDVSINVSYLEYEP